MVGSASRPPLVGRDQELADLGSVLTATTKGTGGALVLTGPPGIGKSRLLEAVAAQSLGLGLATVSGRATELDRVAPLTTLVSALQRNGPHGVDLSTLSEHGGDRFWYIDRIGEALEDYVAQRPLLVIIDDAQWADEFSVLALRVLVPALASSPLRWLLARRGLPAQSAAQEAIDYLIEDGAAQIRLGPLGESAVDELCSSVIGATPDATVLALAARAGGNPFLLEQLLEALHLAGQLVVSGGIATVVGDEVPSGFFSAVDRRLRGLSAQARRLLQAGSVFGRPFTIHAAARLIGVRATELMLAADETVAGAVLFEQDKHLEFCHDLLREAVYNNISGPVRAAMHREAASVVRDEGRSAVEIADHLMGSGPTKDNGAVQTLRDAANEVAARAPGTAANLMVRALELTDEHDDIRPQLSAEAVGLLASAGRLVEAQKVGEAALLGGLDAQTEATVLLGLAEALKHAGQNRTAVDYARRALAKPSVPAPVRAKLHAISAHALLYVDDMPGADRAGEQACRLGTAAGEFSAAVFGNAARSIVARTQGRLADALAYASDAVELADRVRGAARHRHPRIWLGGALAALDRFDDARAAYADGRLEAELLGTAWSQPLWHFLQASLLTWQGALDEAVAEAEAGLRIADRLTARQLSVPLRGLLTRVAVQRAQMPLAREHLRHLQRLLADGITAAPEDVTWTIATFQEAEGNPHVALNTLSTIYDRLPNRLLLLSNDPSAAAVLVRAAMKAGDGARAEVAATLTQQLADRNPGVASLAGAAAHANGLLRGDLDALRTAVQHYRASPRPLARASAMEDAAIAEQAAGNRSRAVELLEEALRESTECGAHRGALRLEKRLRTLGTRRADPARRTPTTSVLDGLTVSELRVAQLVAKGMSNRTVALELFLSPHTVDSHLRHIFGKLAINSRVELTRFVVAHETSADIT